MLAWLSVWGEVQMYICCVVVCYIYALSTDIEASSLFILHCFTDKQ